MHTTFAAPRVTVNLESDRIVHCTRIRYVCYEKGFVFYLSYERDFVMHSLPILLSRTGHFETELTGSHSVQSQCGAINKFLSFVRAVVVHETKFVVDPASPPVQNFAHRDCYSHSRAGALHVVNAFKRSDSALAVRLVPNTRRQRTLCSAVPAPSHSASSLTVRYDFA